MVLPSATNAWQLYNSCLAHGDAQADHVAILKVWRIWLTLSLATWFESPTISIIGRFLGSEKYWDAIKLRNTM